MSKPPLPPRRSSPYSQGPPTVGYKPYDPLRWSPVNEGSASASGHQRYEPPQRPSTSDRTTPAAGAYKAYSPPQRQTIADVPPPIPLSSKPRFTPPFHGRHPSNTNHTECPVSPISSVSPCFIPGSPVSVVSSVPALGKEQVFSPPPLPPRAESAFAVKQAEATQAFRSVRNDLRAVTKAGLEQAKELKEKLRSLQAEDARRNRIAMEDLKIAGKMEADRNRERLGLQVDAAQRDKRASKESLAAYRVSCQEEQTSDISPPYPKVDYTPYNVTELIHELDASQTHHELDTQPIDHVQLIPQLNLSGTFEIAELPGSVLVPDCPEAKPTGQEDRSNERHDTAESSSSVLSDPFVPRPLSIRSKTPSSRDLCSDSLYAPAPNKASIQTEQETDHELASPVSAPGSSAYRQPSVEDNDSASMDDVKIDLEKDTSHTSEAAPAAVSQSALRAKSPPAPYSGPPCHLTLSATGNYYTAANPPCGGGFDHADEYFVGKECLANVVLPWNAFWFRHCDAPEYAICSTCFEFSIRNSTFESSFSCQRMSAGTTRCMFSVPRMTEILWPAAVASNNLRDVLDYMRSHANLPHCRGPSGVTGPASQGLKWFQAKNNALPGFVVCERCYFEYVVGNKLEPRFALCASTQAPNETWSCDISVPYIKRAILRYSKTDEWSMFVDSAKNRLQLPACQGLTSVKVSSRHWYGTDSILMCETCYLDKAALTMFDKMFKKKTVGPEEHSKDVVCDLGVVAIQVALDAAISHSNASLFWNTVKVQSASQLCTKNGITNGKWYTLKGGCENFDVCATCHAGLVCSVGLQDLFEVEKVSQPGSTKCCDFCPATPRFQGFASRYDAAINTPDTSLFTSFVRGIASAPLCKGSKPSHAQWHILDMGHNKSPMHVCRSCFEEFIRHQPLDHLFQLRSEPTSGICEMYSANMRNRWIAVRQASVSEALSAGERSTPIAASQAALAEFTAFRNERIQVYSQTSSEMKRLEASIQSRMFQQSRLNSMGSFYTNMSGRVATASGINYGPGPTYTTTYGNSSVGYGFATPWGVTGAAYNQQASSMTGGNNSDMARLTYLETLWEQYE